MASVKQEPSQAGARIRMLRGMAGLAARELDRLAKITPGHTSLIEGTLGDRVSAKVLAAIGRVLGVSVEWLLTGEGAEPTERRVRSAVEGARTRTKAA